MKRNDKGKGTGEDKGKRVMEKGGYSGREGSRTENRPVREEESERNLIKREGKAER